MTDSDISRTIVSLNQHLNRRSQRQHIPFAIGILLFNVITRIEPAPRTDMSITVSRQDPRYATLKKGRNPRWPAADADAVNRIELCESPADVADALQRAVSAGLRPTVRSG